MGDTDEIRTRYGRYSSTNTITSYTSEIIYNILVIIQDGYIISNQQTQPIHKFCWTCRLFRHITPTERKLRYFLLGGGLIQTEK